MMSIESFSHGRDGYGIGLIGGVVDLHALSDIMQDSQLRMNSSASLSMFGHHTDSRSLCLVRTMPGWPSCAS